MPRPVFFVSDGTGITAETIGHSLLTQFGDVRFDTQRIPFVDSAEKAERAAERIRLEGVRCNLRPIVVNTVVDADISAMLAASGALMLDVFAPFMGPLEAELCSQRKPQVGIQPVGRYAIQIRWSDGHDTGIYPFERLRRLADLGRLDRDAGADASGNPVGG